MKNIVIIGGGTGTFTLLSGLRNYPATNTVIVSSADDGGSTGILRKELKVMPPGDIRQCLLGLSRATKETQELFNFRFNKGSLRGHNVGNIIVAALEKITGSIEQAIYLAGKILDIRGQVLPVTLAPTNLSAVLMNGKLLKGEHRIDDQNPKGVAVPIKTLKLSQSKANPKALQAIKNADVIVFGPGDLFTSILPNILVSGVAPAIISSSAKKVLITNIMTKFGQTDGFRVSDFVRVLESYLRGKIDVVLANDKKPAMSILNKYGKEKANFVELDLKNTKELKVISLDLISKHITKKASGDKLRRSFLRHDSRKVAKLIWGIT
jgi:uncharacterized cofD-like protein